MSVDTSSSIIKSFKNFFLGTFFSRISGFLRDISMAFFFGASPHIASFMVAYRFANLFRRLLGDASFQAGFIPYYESLKIENKKNSALFFRDLFFSLCILLFGIIIASEIGLFIASKIVGDTQIIYLTQIMLVGLVFICLYALNSSFLQCNRNYFLPSVSPVAFNIIWIGAVLVFRNLIDEKFVFVLSIAIVLAFLMQYLTTAPASLKIILQDLSIKELFQAKIFTKEIKKLIRPIFLAIVGIGAVQINSALDAIFAKLCQAKGPAYLWYAIRLYQLPLALFGIALSSAVLPPLARAYKNDNYADFKNFLNLSLRRSSGLMIPSTIGLIILGPSLVNLIFTRGAFLEDALINTSFCLIGYAMGLSFSSFVMIIASAFYAKKEYKVPTTAAIFSVAFNIVLNSIFIFVFNMKSLSIAIATSLSSILNFMILSYFLNKIFRNIFEKETYFSFFKVLTCSLLAAVITISVGFLIKDSSILFLLHQSMFFPKGFLGKLNSFFILSSIYVLSIFICAYISKTKEITEIILNRKNANL